MPAHRNGYRNTIAVFLLMYCVAVPAWAANFNFLKDSVLARFTQQEAEEFVKFVGNRLDSLQDKQVTQWQSSHSSLQGKLKIDFSYNSNDTPCRRALFLISDQTRPTERFQFEVCKLKERWQIQDTPARSLKDSDWQMLRDTGDQALAYHDAGQPFTWRNKKTRNSGVITPLNMETIEGRSCRWLAISIFDRKGNSSNGKYLMCLDENQEWRRHIPTN